MAIADDVKKLFRYIDDNNLFTPEIIDILVDPDKCRIYFASGKFPFLLKISNDIP